MSGIHHELVAERHIRVDSDMVLVPRAEALRHVVYSAVSFPPYRAQGLDQHVAESSVRFPFGPVAVKALRMRKGYWCHQGVREEHDQEKPSCYRSRRASDNHSHSFEPSSVCFLCRVQTAEGEASRATFPGGLEGQLPGSLAVCRILNISYNSDDAERR